jgi:hypothetical protein
LLYKMEELARRPRHTQGCGAFKGGGGGGGGKEEELRHHKI